MHHREAEETPLLGCEHAGRSGYRRALGILHSDLTTEGEAVLDIRIRTSDTGPVRLPNLRGVLDDIASDWTTEIRQRTRSGRDADGRQMRRRADGSVSRLHDSGKMLASLRPTVDDRGFKIAPTGTRNAIVARTHARSRRQFMGADEQQIADARDRVAAALRDRP